MKRMVTALGLVMTLMYVSMGLTCSKSQLTSTAQDVFSALSDAQPLITQLFPGKAAKFAEAVAEAKKLVDAVRASDKTQAAALVADIFPVIDEVASDLGANTKVLALLGLANIGLHVLVNHLPQTAGVSAGGQVAKLAQFRSRPVWRCRDAISGRFEQMQQCRAHPESTVVERY